MFKALNEVYQPTGNVKKCKECGKEHSNKDNFCSENCYDLYHYFTPAPVPTSEVPDPEYVWVVTYYDIEDRESSVDSIFSSEKLANEYIEYNGSKFYSKEKFEIQYRIY